MCNFSWLDLQRVNLCRFLGIQFLIKSFSRKLISWDACFYRLLRYKQKVIIGIYQRRRLSFCKMTQFGPNKIARGVEKLLIAKCIKFTLGKRHIFWRCESLKALKKTTKAFIKAKSGFEVSPPVLFCFPFWEIIMNPISSFDARKSLGRGEKSLFNFDRLIQK